MDEGWNPVLEQPEAGSASQDDDESNTEPELQSPKHESPPLKAEPVKSSTPVKSATEPEAPQIKPVVLNLGPNPVKTQTTNGKRKIDEVSNKSNEPVAKRMLTAPMLRTVKLKDGRTVVLKDGKIVATIKSKEATSGAEPVKKAPAKTLSAPVTGKPRTFPTSKPPPIQPNTGEAPPAVGYPMQPMGYPNPYSAPSYYAPQHYPQHTQPVPGYNMVQHARSAPPPEVPAPASRSPEKECAAKRESRWGEAKKYDLKAVVDACCKFLESRTPDDAMQRWKFQGINGYQIRKSLQKNFPYIKVSDFEVERWEEFVLKHVPNSEMVGLNVRLKPSIPNELKRPMEVVVKYLKKHEPKRVEDRVFWKGVGLSVLLGHVQKECPNFKFQRWYKKWKKFVAEIPECQFFQEGNSVSVRLFVENRTEIFERESIRKEVQRVQVSRTKSAAKSLETMTGDISMRMVEKESVTLFDILGQCPIEFPARGPRCTHIQPFELSNYLKNNMFPSAQDESPRWRCQICGEMCRKEEVYIDGFWKKVIEFQEVKNSTPNVVFLYPDGQVGFKRDSEIVKFEILNEQEKIAGRKKEWEVVVLPVTDRFEAEDAEDEPEKKSPSKDNSVPNSSPDTINDDKETIDRSKDNDKTDEQICKKENEEKIETFPPVPMRSTQKNRRKGSSEHKRSISRQKKRRSRSLEKRSNSYERRRPKDHRRGRRRWDHSEEKSRRRRRRSRSRQRERRKTKPTRNPSPAPMENDDNIAVSTSLLDLYEEMVSNTLSTKRGEITIEEAKQLAKLQSQCCVEEPQHLEVLRRLGLSMPSR